MFLLQRGRSKQTTGLRARGKRGGGGLPRTRSGEWRTPSGRRPSQGNALQDTQQQESQWNGRAPSPSREGRQKLPIKCPIISEQQRITRRLKKVSNMTEKTKTNRNSRNREKTVKIRTILTFPENIPSILEITLLKTYTWENKKATETRDVVSEVKNSVSSEIKLRNSLENNKKRWKRKEET